MKKMFKEQLFDYLFQALTKRQWEMDWDCEKSINLLIDVSIMNMDYNDCLKEEMRQLAKTNLVTLLTAMRIDAKRRGLWYLDTPSILNGLSNFKCLWPFKTIARSGKINFFLEVESFKGQLKYYSNT
jgi:hypothetical protein